MFCFLQCSIHISGYFSPKMGDEDDEEFGPHGAYDEDEDEEDEEMGMLPYEFPMEGMQQRHMQNVTCRLAAPHGAVLGVLD